MEPLWYEVDRGTAALETLEHAVELHGAGASPSLVLAVGHEAWLYFAEHGRRGKKGRSADLELVDVLNEALGPGFDSTWARQRANELADDLRAFETRRSPAPLLRFRSWSPVFMLLCTIADCRRVLGRTSAKLDAWREAQTTRALQACIS